MVLSITSSLLFSLRKQNQSWKVNISVWYLIQFMFACQSLFVSESNTVMIFNKVNICLQICQQREWLCIFIWGQQLQLTLQKNDSQHNRKEINSSGTIRLTYFEQRPKNDRTQWSNVSFGLCQRRKRIWCESGRMYNRIGIRVQERKSSFVCAKVYSLAVCNITLTCFLISLM
jgi:hypothetical protein